MAEQLQVSCFDVDHAKNPRTRRASNLDRVSITCVGDLGGCVKSEADFIVDLCSFSSLQTRFLFGRVCYLVGDDPRETLASVLGDRVRLLDSDSKKGSNAVCLETDDRQTATDILSRFWRCYGGSWIIAADCRDADLFVSSCAQAEAHVITPSDARDRLVRHSRIVAVTFDDNILDVVTENYTALQMQSLLTQAGERHGYLIQIVET